jgi:hypothetical protein
MALSRYIKVTPMQGVLSVMNLPAHSSTALTSIHIYHDIEAGVLIEMHVALWRTSDTGRSLTCGLHADAGDGGAAEQL